MMMKYHDNKQLSEISIYRLLLVDYFVYTI